MLHTINWQKVAIVVLWRWVLHLPQARGTICNAHLLWAVMHLCMHIAQCTTRSNSQVCVRRHNVAIVVASVASVCLVNSAHLYWPLHFCVCLYTSVFACTHLCVCCRVNSTHTDVFAGIKWQLWWGVLHLYQDPSPLARGSPSLCQYIHLVLLSGNTA